MRVSWSYSNESRIRRPHSTAINRLQIAEDRDYQGAFTDMSGKGIDEFEAYLDSPLLVYVHLLYFVLQS